MWNTVNGGLRPLTLDEEGYLVGPYDPLLRSPLLGRRLADLGDAIRSGSVPARHREIVILAVAARYRTEFIWSTHAEFAVQFGVPADAVEAIGDGLEPQGSDPLDLLTYRAAIQLLDGGTLDADTAAQLEAAFGAAGLLEVIAYTAYYCTFCWIGNVCGVPIPTGAAPRWTDA
jgi:4-carboxymuconolactone decarboxylase